MARVLPSLLLSALAVASLNVHAQRRLPDAPSATEIPPPAQKALPPVPVLKVDTRIVIVDVVVTDKNQNPVHGLQAIDFQISEDGSKEAIKHFEEHAPVKAGVAPPMPKMPLNVFTNYTPTPAGGALNVVLLDALNTPLRNQLRVRQQLLAYLHSIPPGTRVAIFGLNGTLSLLQGFTSDKEVLIKALEQQPAQASAVITDVVGGSGIQNSLADNVEDNPPATGQDTHLAELIVANIRQFEVDEKAADLNIRARDTLNAMDQIGHYLSGLPGRKNILWFSASFPMAMRPQDGDKSPFGVVTNYEDDFRRTVNLLTRAQVALYPIDSRGLFNSPATDASTSRNYSGTTGAIRVAKDREAFFLDTSDEHSTMLELAEATGGRAYFDTNGLTEAAAAAIQAGENYYTITYTPSDGHHKNNFRNIKVQLDQKGFNLAYRRGYFSDTENPGKEPSPKDHPANVSVGTSTAPGDSRPDNSRNMQAAMMRGGPAPTEVLFKVSVSTPAAPATFEDVAAPGNTPSPKVHGPYRRYSVDYSINPSDIMFAQTAEGRIHADMKLVTFVYNVDGKLLNSNGSVIHISPTVDQVRALLAGPGLRSRQEVSVPARGEYFLRIAVVDLNRDRSGAVEIATSQVKPLQPAGAAPAPK